MKPMILVVEDERSVADSIVYALRTDGCEPVWVTTGGAAREELRAREIALIILDIGLPDVNGFDLCREIRRSHEVPIIFLTARAEELDRVAGLEIGADDYVTKPFSPRELSARVRTVLRRTLQQRSRSAAPAVSSSFPFSIDDHRRLISYFGKTLTLTHAEYRLLEQLVRRPGWVYSREQLLDLLWDEPGATSARGIDSHVKSLRSKLRAVRPDVEAIETRRGQGYALRERW
ncbi:MAG: two-component system response regulator CreB [Vicinamibacteria bacterium]|nr:two-component system response regulator CreB [Vicinamibacteria bacterium]